MALRCFLVFSLFVSHGFAASTTNPCTSVASIASTLKSRSATSFCSALLPITTKTSTSTKTNTAFSAAATVTTTSTVTKNIISTVVTTIPTLITTIKTYTAPSTTITTIVTNSVRLKARDTDGDVDLNIRAAPVSTPTYLTMYPSKSLSLACSCLSLPTPSVTAFATATTTVKTTQTVTAFKTVSSNGVTTVTSRITLVHTSWVTITPTATITITASTTLPTTTTVRSTTSSPISTTLATVSTTRTTLSTSATTTLSTSTLPPSATPTFVLGNCKPYVVEGVQAFSSAGNPSLFGPGSFVAYGLNSSAPSLRSVTANVVDENNVTTLLLYNYDDYASTGAVTIVSPDGTNLILRNDGTMTAFAGEGCTQPVTQNFADSSSTPTKREVSATVEKRQTTTLQASAQYIECPVVSVELHLTDKCRKPESGARPYVTCNLNKKETLKLDGLEQTGPKTVYMKEVSPAVYQADCPMPTIRNQTSDPFCNGAADGLVKFCRNFRNLGVGIKAVPYGTKVPCTALGLAVSAYATPVVGKVVNWICTGAFSAFPYFCDNVEHQTDYCTPPPTSLTLDVQVTGYGSLAKQRNPSLWPSSNTIWHIGDPPPQQLVLEDYDDSYPLDECYKTKCGPGESLQPIFSPWRAVYAGHLFEDETTVPCYWQYKAFNFGVDKSLDYMAGYCKQQVEQSGGKYVAYSATTSRAYDTSRNMPYVTGTSCSMYTCELTGNMFTRDIDAMNAGDCSGSCSYVYYISENVAYSRSRLGQACIPIDSCFDCTVA